MLIVNSIKRPDLGEHSLIDLVNTEDDRNVEDILKSMLQ